ncbi:MAG: DUF559 domain-containing protein [Alphaproteobacteria bacterium]|nr:DUF559 domain-containing protein [Alphaproteobacteria bacterium]
MTAESPRGDSLRIKICGIRDSEGLRAAVEAGADFVGFVFYPGSPRFVTVEQAAILSREESGSLKKVGLFVDPDLEELGNILARAPLDFIQLHGEETPAFISKIKEKFGIPVIKALRVAQAHDLDQAGAYEEVADWLLFDSKPYAPPPSKRGEAGRGIVSNARILRKTMTSAERLLWTRISRRQVGGFKFRRQHPVPPYIGDFVCLERQLIIELDGSQHIEQESYDWKRTEYLESHGYRILRFWNKDVMENTEGVLETILDHLQNPPPLSSPLRKGGGVMPGGTGQSFDWSLLAGRRFKKPWMLAGGLHAGNIAQALSVLMPDALDVSSGVESAPGVKDPEKIKAFVEAARAKP